MLCAYRLCWSASCPGISAAVKARRHHYGLERKRRYAALLGKCPAAGLSLGIDWDTYYDGKSSTVGEVRHLAASLR